MLIILNQFLFTKLFKLLRVLNIEKLHKKQAKCLIYKTNTFKIKNQSYNTRQNNI